MRRCLLALLACALLGAAAPAASAAPSDADRGRAPYALLQMNLCLSGLAGCFADTQYPAVVHEAIAKSARRRPTR